MRPSLGYSNWYWINKDKKEQAKKAQEQAKTIETVSEPIQEETPQEPEINLTGALVRFDHVQNTLNIPTPTAITFKQDQPTTDTNNPNN